MASHFFGPVSYRLNAIAGDGYAPSVVNGASDFGLRLFKRATDGGAHPSHPSLGHLILLVFEAVLEVVCVSLPGYIVARAGMFDADNQKFAANLNVALFTPCLIFTKLASQLTADKLLELAVIPIIFAIQMAVSYTISILVSKAFGFGKRPANFVTAMGVFGNSNSLPISLVISLSQTLKGLHWDKIPGDNDDEVSARGILYLLIFQQLGQLVRWSWGYHVLLAPPESYEEEAGGQNAIIEEGRYSDNPELIPGLDGNESQHAARNNGSTTSTSFESGGRTPVTNAHYAESFEDDDDANKAFLDTPLNGNMFCATTTNGHTQFPSIRTPNNEYDDSDLPDGIKGWAPKAYRYIQHGFAKVGWVISSSVQRLFYSLPHPVQTFSAKIHNLLTRFFSGVWEFMNPPLWAMLLAVIVASIPDLQRIFFEEDSFIANSVTRAVSQSGGVAVPLILVVLGANLARNTLPKETLDPDSEENKIGTKLLIASLISRMLLPTIVMAPILALVAKYIPVSIVDDPIFVIVCFLLTGAPSALQLAQICQINGVYEGVMSKLLFQSYVIWILPSTLILVMSALEVVEWAM
ncbi:auxin efflux carrier [Calycina marina]|uniref:Auxin efflux carrier n=1 Tax=Calycina marina TaxID=1763456 RepID=A0A9P7YVR9_9HELO|nr:auxin efflux carrier [Calycina marina]